VYSIEEQFEGHEQRSARWVSKWEESVASAISSSDWVSSHEKYGRNR
jgi:hypothetical protein